MLAVMLAFVEHQTELKDNVKRDRETTQDVFGDTVTVKGCFFQEAARGSVLALIYCQQPFTVYMRNSSNTNDVFSCLVFSSLKRYTHTRHSTRVTKPNSDISHPSDRRPTTRDKRRFKYKYVDGLRVFDHVMFDLQIR